MNTRLDGASGSVSGSAGPVRLPIAKLVLDKVLALALAVVTFPVWLTVCLAQIIQDVVSPANRGGILYFEPRISAGREFLLVKFRILTGPAIEEIRRGAIPKTVENRPRNVTPVGRVLKKYGLDELAQILNVLGGTMSFVGPRPRPRAECEKEFARGEFVRARLRPGISGPAQIMKGTSRSAKDELGADQKYLRLVESGRVFELIRTDIKIIGTTLRVMAQGTGE